jgi:hypothetical protein
MTARSPGLDAGRRATISTDRNYKDMDGALNALIDCFSSKEHTEKNRECVGVPKEISHALRVSLAYGAHSGGFKW